MSATACRKSARVRSFTVQSSRPRVHLWTSSVSDWVMATILRPSSGFWMCASAIALSSFASTRFCAKSTKDLKTLL